MQKSLFILLLALFFVQHSLAKGRIEGRVTDENNQALIGATILIEGTSSGAKSDINGNFILNDLAYANYTLTIGYIGYEKKQISDIAVTSTSPVQLTISLQPAKKGLNDLVIKSSYKKESLNALLVQQKNMATISDGISAEMIRKSPDKNSGDVLKRVSGISISEGKFAIIRGLSDRYNVAMLNGSILPSSEADRKAFSFDLFPAALLDNITVIKASLPEYPAEFAGGLIELNTKDIPNENYVSIQVGSGGNSMSTGKKYYDGVNGKTDWLGLDNHSRDLPSSFPASEVFHQSSSLFTKNDRIEAAKTLTNNWGIFSRNAMPPNRVIQLTGAYSYQFKNKSSLGAIAAITYNRSQRFQTVSRKEYELDDAFIYHYTDSVYRDNVLAGAMLNIGYKINTRHKITFRSNYSINSEDQSIRRSGVQVINEQYVQSSSTNFSSNTLWVSQWAGEHTITKQKIKLDWAATYNDIFRNTPDLKKTYMIRNYNNPDDTLFRAYVPFQASPNYSGRFFSTLREKVYNAKADITVPFKIQGVNQHIKAGYFVQHKDRVFRSRELGYVIADISQYNNALELLPEDKIFAPENMNIHGYKIDDITQGTNSYTAGSDLMAAYFQFDNKFLNKFRLVWGFRYENYLATVHSRTTQPIDVENKFANLLPSCNLTYAWNKKINLRFCASKTLSRPEFRELAPFPFYDYNTSSVLVGNTKLVQAEISNLDLRYEWYPSKGQLLTASLFYKHFNHPIEAVLDAGSTAGSRSFTYGNANEARNYGVEVEFRKSLAFLSSNEKSIWHQVSVFGNMSYIRSRIQIQQKTASGDTTYTRALQGQSPYVINAGITANIPQWKSNVSLLYNRIGERITLIGNTYIPDLYEKPRNVLDVQIGKQCGKHAEVKLTVGDILQNAFVFYQNGRMKNPNRYSAKQDLIVTEIKAGYNASLSFSYKF